MVRHTQTICRQQPTNCLSVFDHFLGLALEGLKDHSLKNYVGGHSGNRFELLFFSFKSTANCSSMD